MFQEVKPKENGMQYKTIQVKKMLEQLFSNKYDAVQFSIDFPSFCLENYDELEKEHKGLGYYLDQVVPDICSEGEPGFDPTHMIEELKKVYQKVLEFIEN